MTKRQRRANRIAMLLGVLATAAALGAYAGGLLERIELITLDLRYRWTNSVHRSDEIACVDIDDRTLELAGRWPWPRDVQASLISILAELGANQIVVDITYVEEQSYRTVAPDNLDVFYKPGEFDSTLADDAYPDATLAEAIHRAGNVYLAFHHPQDVERRDDFQIVVDRFLAGDESGARQAADVVSRALKREISDPLLYQAQRPELRARVVAALERDPTLTEDELAARLRLESAGRDTLREFTERARLAALRRITQRWLDRNPDAATGASQQILIAVYRSISDRPLATENIVLNTLAVAVREVLGYRATTERTLVARTDQLADLPRVDGIAPVYFTLARAAKRCGFVNFEPDSDGVMRRERFLAMHGGHVLSQLAFTAACDRLGLTTDQIRITRDSVELSPPGRTPLTVQLDSDGRTLVPWSPGNDWTQQFQHVSADALWNVYDLRRQISHNREALADLLSAEADAPLPELAREYRADRESLGKVLRQQRDARLASDWATVDDDQTVIDGARAALQQREREYVRHLDVEMKRQAALPASGTQSDPEPRARIRQFRDRANAYSAAIARLESEISATLDRLRPIVANRICLIGYTATSLADMTPIPTHRRAPGVMAHANVINGILTGQLVHWAPPWLNVALAAAWGFVASVFSVRFKPRTALLLVLSAIALYVGIAGAFLFYQFTLRVDLMPSVAALILPFVAISAYRYIFIDSERRQLATALGQYTSKEIARQVAENPELCQRAETREVTAMFTDLRGFTTISERIGAERTQKVLNSCLGRFVDVMLQHEAMVNKFIGDGIFAFWNPVIFPQADHALRACETAVDLLVGLDNLKREQRAAGGDDVFDELLLRIGVATGNAVVGPCGSEQKFDYTCIGDSVNVAARLESANKFFGTRILIAGGAYDQVRGKFAVRSLGGVQVKGKTTSVPVYELLGRIGAVNGEPLAYAEEFAAAVESFQRRDWPEAVRRFQACRDRRPDDLAAEGYLEAAVRHAAAPPPPEWNGAIELTEK